MTSFNQYAYYKNRIITFKDEKNKLKKKSRQYSFVRLCLFLCFVSSLFLLFKTHYIVLSYITLFISLGFFIQFVIKYNRLDHVITLLSSKIQINEDELFYLNHKYTERNTGEKYATINASLSTDFDLFGNGSLFQYINRCNTQKGSHRLAQSFCFPDKSSELIQNKQIAIKELCDNNEFIQDFQSITKFIKGDGTETILQSWMVEIKKDFATIRIFAIVFGLINFVCLLLSAFNILPWEILPFTLTISLIFVSIHNKRILKTHSQLINIANNLENYIATFQLIENQMFKSKHLLSLKKSLILNNTTTSKILKSLHNIISVFDYKQNRLLSFLLNSFFLLDIHIFYFFSRWKLKYNNNTSIWFNAINEMETLISFATYAFNNYETVVYPTVSAEAFNVQVKEMGHPLIKPDVRVNNDFYISGMPSTLIITGANMAGKSTFLRTIGVNLLLAMNGAPVVAKIFSFTPCDIFSCIKIQDSLINNESYFYAELLRLKEIIEHTQKQPKTLVILDEILRGTNTKDKQTGSLGFIEKLIRLRVPVIVATHDLIIGELEQKYPDIAANHCFEVELLDDQLFFDYKLKEGISKKLNASFLMKKMEIID